MKRDMELVYAMLSEVEARSNGFKDDDSGIKVEGREKGELDYHARLLFSAGLVKGNVSESIGGHYSYWVSHLTNAGHNFLEDWKRDKSSIRLEDKDELREVAEQLKEIERHLDRIERGMMYK